MTLIERLSVAVTDANPFRGVDISVATFRNEGRVHDWRNYIPEAVRELWPELSEEARLVALLVAEVGANREHWD